MKILTGDTYKLNGACQYGYTRDGQKITIEPYETIIKIRENFWDRIKLRNMWRIFGTFTEVDIDQSIIDRYFSKQEKIRMRDATKEELEGVDNYIESISKPTGVNFFDEIEDTKMTEAEIRYYQRTHMLNPDCLTVPTINTKCPINYDLDECSSKEYGYECRTCVNYNPLRMLYEKEKNGVKLGVPIEVVLDDAIVQFEKLSR